MRLSLTRAFIASILLLGLLSAPGCKLESNQEYVNESDESNQTPTTSTPITGSSIDPQNFTITENEEGVPVMTGTLSDGLTLNARLYCVKDLEKPGTASVDVAELRSFVPADLDILLQDAWKITSDTIETFERDGAELNYRTVLYQDAYNHDGSVANTNYGIQIGRDGLSAPTREPWFSEEFTWQTEDFTFMTETMAFNLLRDLAASSGVQISNVYQVDRVPANTLEAFYRVRLSYGESLPEMQWTKEDDAYSFALTQDWNGLPINTSGLASTYDGTSLEGESYRIMFGSVMSGMVTAEDIQNFQMYNIYENVTTGEDQDLISLWDALATFRNHIDNPQYETETFYRLSTDPNQDLTIDQIELCYVPIWQGEVGIAEQAPYDMIPCWTFRVVGYEENGSTQIFTGVVNAITGAYILQTNNMLSA